MSYLIIVCHYVLPIRTSTCSTNTPNGNTTMTEACENAILAFLSSSPDQFIADTFPWSEEQKLDHLKVVGAVKSLHGDGFVATEDISFSCFEPSKEAASILESGSQEMIVLKAVSDAGKMSIPDLQKAVGKDVAKIGMGNCMKAKWLKKDGGDLVPLVKAEEATDEVRESLETMQKSGYALDSVDNKVRQSDAGVSHVSISHWLTSFNLRSHKS